MGFGKISAPLIFGRPKKARLFSAPLIFGHPRPKIQESKVNRIHYTQTYLLVVCKECMHYTVRRNEERQAKVTHNVLSGESLTEQPRRTHGDMRRCVLYLHARIHKVCSLVLCMDECCFECCLCTVEELEVSFSHLLYWYKLSRV